MTDFATFIIPALLVLGVGTFLILLLSPLIVHLQVERRRRRRGGRYVR